MAMKNAKTSHLTTASKKADVFQLVEKEREHFFNLANDIILVADTKTGMLVDANMAAQKFFGKNIKEIRKMHQSQIHVPKDRAKYKKLFKQIIKTGGTQSDIYILDRHNQLVATDVNANFIKIGKRLYVQGIFRDVSDRKRIEAELTKQKRKFETIFDLLPDFVIYKSKDDKFLEVNKALVDFVGLPKEKIIGKTTFDLLKDKKIAQATRNDDLEIIKTGRPKFGVIRELTTPFSGKHIWGMYSKMPFFDDQRKVIGTLTVTSDITKIIESEKEIERQKRLAFENLEKTKAILENIADYVFVVDRDYKITMMNKAACQLVGCPVDKSVGRHYSDVFNFVYEKTRRINDQFIKSAIEKGIITEISNHTLLIKLGGEEIPVLDSAAPIKNKDNQVTGCVVVFRDITKERNIDKIKTEFVSIASHQLRTPLTGIKWFLELLLNQKIGSLNDKQVDFLNQVALSNERMISLVGDLLSVSRIEAGGQKFQIVKRNINVASIIKGIIADNAILIKEKKVKISSCADKMPKIMALADHDHIRQVFQNLITNAIKYSNNNGLVEIGCSQKNKEIVFYIKDQGVGIPLNQHKRVFDKFFRADNVITKETSGTGLGLYIAKAIIEGHNGRIWFESQEDHGTTFYFSLPKK